MPQSHPDGLPAIETLIPHRPPFRFVDRVVACYEAAGCCALALQKDDPRLQNGVLPPLYLLEALAQSAAAYHGCALQRAGSTQRETGMLVQIDKATLHASARAGEDVILEIQRSHTLGAMVRFTGRARVGDRPLAEAGFIVMRGTDV